MRAFMDNNDNIYCEVCAEGMDDLEEFEEDDDFMCDCCEQTLKRRYDESGRDSMGAGKEHLTLRVCASIAKEYKANQKQPPIKDIG